jgi:hypothetical protein
LKKSGDKGRSSSSSSSSGSDSGRDGGDGNQVLSGEAEFYAQLKKLSASTTIGGDGTSSLTQIQAQAQTQVASAASEEARARLLANLAEVCFDIL